MIDQALDVASKARVIIESEYCNTSLNLTNISKQACVEKCHLSKMFKKEYGITIQKYLFEKRLTHLRKLIALNPNIPVTILLHKAGFVSYRSLAHYLKIHHHVKPSDLYLNTLPINSNIIKSISKK
jgi:transcriptional regulator GlxA family with amidase domain